MRAAEIQDEKLRASLQTTAGCRDYLEHAASARFGSRDLVADTADFERLRIALDYAFSHLDRSTQALEEGVLRVYVQSIKHSQIRKDNVYETSLGPFLRAELRAQDAQWVRVRQLIEERGAGLLPDRVRSLHARMEKTLKAADHYAQDDEYYANLHYKALEQA
jgi:hypothetical protein